MMPVPLMESGDGYWAAKPEYYYISGVTMLLFGILDNWTFMFNPLQKSIFLDKEKGAHSFYRAPSETHTMLSQGTDALLLSNENIPTSPRHSGSLSGNYQQSGKQIIDKDTFDTLKMTAKQ